MSKLSNLRSLIMIILLPQLLWSCGQRPQSNTTQITESTSVQDVQLNIDTFSTFPPEIDGCACYFSTNETEFNNHTYIYADDYQNTAFVSINGVMTKFELSTSNNSDEHSIETFVNDEYEIIIDLKQVGQLDETWQKEGTLTITPKNGKEIVKTIYGECGC